MNNQTFISQHTLNDPNWLGIWLQNGAILSAEQIRIMLEEGMTQGELHLLIQKMSDEQPLR